MEKQEELQPGHEGQEKLLQLENAISKTFILSDTSAEDAHCPPESSSSSRGSPDPKISGILHSLITEAHACRYEFAEYFVAWQGVLTVAFSGIPPSICHLKQSIDLQLGGCLARENPGSKWPKISLGCLRDGATLSLDQLRNLRQICSEEGSILAATEPVMVDDLSLVVYANCCLEKTITVATTPLSFPPDFARPSSEEIFCVQNVLSEFSLGNVETYHTFTSKPGNRSAHYRNLKAGATLVHFLKSVPIVLARFRARVDSELPGMYDWFRDNSLHITVRALI